MGTIYERNWRYHFYDRHFERKDNEKPECMPISKKELHLLLEDKSLVTVPILVIGNKIDV